MPVEQLKKEIRNRNHNSSIDAQQDFRVPVVSGARFLESPAAGRKPLAAALVPFPNPGKPFSARRDPGPPPEPRGPQRNPRAAVPRQTPIAQ